jgi:hypothetical protein
LDSDSTSFQTCFLNLLLEFTRTTYSGNIYRIGLPDWLTRISLGQLTQSSPECLIRLQQCLSGLICSYLTESPYPILLPIGLLLTRPYTVLPNQISLPDPFSVRLLPTRLYPTTLSDFLTRPDYPPMHIPSSRFAPCNILWCNNEAFTKRRSAVGIQ